MRRRPLLRPLFLLACAGTAFATGCALIFDMDPYEGGRRPSDGNDSSVDVFVPGIDVRVDANPMFDVSVHIPTFDSGAFFDAPADTTTTIKDSSTAFDADFSTIGCTIEDEPNDTPATTDVFAGTYCGTIPSISDLDVVYVNLVVATELEVALEPYLRLIVYPASGGPTAVLVSSRFTLNAGEYLLRFDSVGGTGKYKLAEN